MATRAPLTEAEKQYICERKQEGRSLKQIAQGLGCARETARKWWRHKRDKIEPKPRGRPRRGVLSTYPQIVREKAVEIKQTHPHWGPAMVKLELKKQLQLEADELPSDARLSALFKAECPESVQSRQRQVYPAQSPPPITRPHQRWQMDGKEKVPLADKDVVTILNIRDPVGALMIASDAFLTTTEKWLRKLTLEEVQDTLRQAFQIWGMPLEIQTDREQVYIGAPQCPFPSNFTLWLAGLGIQHIVSRKKQPTDQAHVERNHRTLGDMVWKDEYFEELQPLQAALDERRCQYNEEFPAQAADCAGQPPLSVHPWARHSGRVFHSDVEWDLFDLQRVDAYLASFVWTRKVSPHGEVRIGAHSYQVGCTHKAESVSVRFIPVTRTFRFEASDASWTIEHEAVGLDKIDLIGRAPAEQCLPCFFQLPLPLEGV